MLTPHCDRLTLVNLHRRHCSKCSLLGGGVHRLPESGRGVAIKAEQNLNYLILLVPTPSTWDKANLAGTLEFKQSPYCPHTVEGVGLMALISLCCYM